MSQGPARGQDDPPASLWPTTPAGWTSGVLCLVTALVVTPMALMVSRVTLTVAGARVPWGLALAAIGSAALVVLARQVSRFHATVAALAWMFMLIVLLLEPRGETLVFGDALGYAFLVVGPVVVLGTAVLTMGGRP